MKRKASSSKEAVFTFNKRSGSITDYRGPGGAVVIPDSIGGKPVKKIDDWAFYYCKSLTSVTIPDGVTSIGMEAFGHCTSLASVVMPTSLKSIGDGAFYYCASLASVVMPDSLKSIGDWAFAFCLSLASVSLPPRVRIGKDAFYKCPNPPNNN
jgi:hypothetical protein